MVPGGYPNDTYPAFLSSGETVIPPDKLGSGVLGGANVRVRIDVSDIKVKGSDIYISLKETERLYKSSY